MDVGSSVVDDASHTAAVLAEPLPSVDEPDVMAPDDRIDIDAPPQSSVWHAKSLDVRSLIWSQEEYIEVEGGLCSFFLFTVTTIS
jgi:hypothetical protein